MTSRFTLIAFVLALQGCASSIVRDSYPALAAIERLPLHVCEIDGVKEPLLCGTFRVPESRDDGGSRTIDINIVVVPSVNPNPDRQAWIEHPGGPRYSTVGTAHYFAKGGWLERFRQNIDVVLVDVRGLHQSGALYCEALKYPRVLTRYYPPDKVRACRQELELKVDLKQYSTVNAIKDYEDIREWLGYRKWDVGGWSYGSRFMLTYIHLYPNSIRTASLFVPSILNFRRPLDYARFGQHAFDRLMVECLSDPACSLAFPTVSTDLYVTLDRLSGSPAPLEFVDPVTGETQDRLLTRDVFAETIWVGLLDVTMSRNLPYVLHHSARGNFKPFIEFAAPQSAPASEPEGHYFSVVCPEETSQLSLKQADEAALGTFVGSYIAKDYIEACKAWGLPLSKSHPIVPKVFDIPALIVTGENDPVTPPEYGEINAKHFTDALHITVPNMHHGGSGMENSNCLTEILTTFVEQGSSEGLDTSCVGEMSPPPFRTSN